MGWFSTKMNNQDFISKRFSPNSSNQLKDGLVGFFHILQKTARVRLVLKFLLIIFFFLGISWMSLSVSDRIWETPVAWRSVILFTGIFLSTWAAWNLFLHIFRHTCNTLWLAKKVRGISRAKGERLLGIAEIAKTGSSAELTFSSQIFEAAQQKMLEEISSIEPGEVFPWKIVRNPAIFASTIFVIMVFFCFSFPELSRNSFYRWALPFSPIERATLTAFTNIEKRDLYIIANESHVTRFSLSKNSKGKPNYASLHKTAAPGFDLMAPINGQVYEFRLPPQKESFSTTLQAGDFSREFKVKPIPRPKLESVIATVEYPAYLSMDTEDYEVLNHKISVPEHSKIFLHGNANREISKLLLKSGQAQIGQNPDAIYFDFQLGKIRENQNYELHLMDRFGFSQMEPDILFVDIQKDLPPSVRLNPQTDISPVLAFETRKISFQHSDDFGLSEISLLFEISKGSQSNDRQVLFRKFFPSRGEISFDLSFPFDPSLFDIGDGDEIVFYASSKDHYPHRDTVYSKPLKLKVVGPEKHAEMIRVQMDLVIAEVSEIARWQEAIQFETLSLETTIKDKDDRELDRKSANEISNLQGDQKDLASSLDSITRSGFDTLNEATKNPLFDLEILREFATSLQKMEETSQNPMREAKQKLNAAGNSQTSKASQSMLQAAESQQKALDKLRDVLAKFSNQLDKLEAITLAERLRKLKRTEQKISQKLVSLLPSSIGRMTTQLNNDNRVSVYEMEKIQSKVSLDADEIKNEISRYHERTNKPEYGEVSQLMTQAKAKQELASVAQSLRNNISFQALNGLNQWEQLFELWAKLLQVNSPSGDSSGGNAGGKDKTAEILSLLKIRKTQNEILFKTSNLDREGFRGNKDNWASSLTKQQNTLMIDLTDTQISMAEEAINPLFDDTHMAMSKSSEKLSQQVFTQVTQEAQKESVEILSDLINLLIEGQGQGEQAENKENLTAMELLMMQMGNKNSGEAKGKSPLAGKTGGGSSQGGSPKKVINSLKGNNSSPIKVDASSQSNGSGNPSIAPEFQQAMEKYFKAIED